MPEPGAASLGRSLLPRQPGCSLRRRLGTLPQFGEGDKLHKSCWPAPEGDALCRAHLTPRGAPGTSPQPRAQGPCRRPATRSARRRSVAPPPCPPPSLRSPLALVPTPRGNLKHGDPNGGFRLIDREKTRRPSRPFRRGLRERPLTPSPRPEAGSQAPRAGPADAAARRRPERAGPWARGSAHRLVPAGAPARPGWRPRARPGSRSGPAGSGFWRFGQPCGAEATHQRRSPARLAPGLRVVLRTSQKEDPLRVPRLPQAEKLPPLGREPGRAGACGRARRASSALCAGGAGVGRKLQTRAACRGSPPPCRRLGGSAELRRGHTPRDDAENANLVLTPLPGCGGGGHLRS